MYVAMGGILLNILLSFFFVRGLHTGLWGLALAASIAANLIALVLLIMLNKRLRLFKGHDGINLLKLIVSTLLMSVITYYVDSLLPIATSLGGKLLALVLPAACGILVYVLLLFLLRTDEAKEILNLLYEKTKKVN